MNWKYATPLSSVAMLSKFEKLVQYHLPEEFQTCVIRHNGGRPDRRLFESGGGQRVLKTFLSFNKDDRETVWDIYEWNRMDLGDHYVPFAICEGGDLVCFDKYTDHVILLVLDTLNTEQIGCNFSDFISNLQ